MIKCPGCGERVSTMAGTCPHCGVYIAGNLKKCPDCGTYCLYSQRECPHCHSALSVVMEETFKREDQPGNAGQKNGDINPPKRKNKSAIVSIAFLVIVILATGGLYYLNCKNDAEREEAEFASLENTTNPEYYNDFLAKYPESVHCQEVKERLNILLDETAEWEKLMQNINRSEIEKFINAHPYSKRLHICEDMIDSIDWAKAQKIHTEEAIVNYLNEHPNGKYAEEASLQKNELGLTRITVQDKAVIRSTLESFFTIAMSKQDVSLISDAILGKMENFCGTQDATPEQIIAFAQNKMATDVLGLHYTIQDDLAVRKQTISDGTTGYAVNFTVQEIISRSDTNKPSTQSYNVSALLNAEHKIIRMYIR